MDPAEPLSWNMVAAVLHILSRVMTDTWVEKMQRHWNSYSPEYPMRLSYMDKFSWRIDTPTAQRYIWTFSEVMKEFPLLLKTDFMRGQKEIQHILNHFDVRLDELRAMISPEVLTRLVENARKSVMVLLCLRLEALTRIRCIIVVS